MYIRKYCGIKIAKTILNMVGGAVLDKWALVHLFFFVTLMWGRPSEREPTPHPNLLMAIK